MCITGIKKKEKIKQNKARMTSKMKLLDTSDNNRPVGVEEVNNVLNTPWLYNYRFSYLISVCANMP